MAILIYLAAILFRYDAPAPPRWTPPELTREHKQHQAEIGEGFRTGYTDKGEYTEKR
jgi:hypothetical protein